MTSYVYALNIIVLQYTLLDDYLRDEGIDPKTLKQDSRFFVSKNTGKKNKWRKHRERWNNYRLSQEKKIESIEEYILYVKEKLWKYLEKETFGYERFNSNTQQKEKTHWYFFIQCPYHEDKTASMIISKNRIGLCKCFWCGMSINFNRMWRETNYISYSLRAKRNIFDTLNISTRDNEQTDDLPF